MIKLSSIIIFILFLQGCGFKSIYKIERGSYSIIKFETTGDEKISRDLISNFEKFQKNKDSKYSYELISNAIVNKEIRSKNSSGISENLSISILINIQVKENGEILVEKLFQENVSYSNLENKFELNQYENIIIKNQTRKIINKVNLYISSLK